jgi:PD-(D/E)XK endonuclease
MLTTDQKGSIAETAIVSAAVKLHIGVFKPLTDGERYDLIFNLRPQLVRVQCKRATRQGDVILVRCYSNRRTRDGMLTRCYTADETDVIAAYCAEVDRCFVIPPRLFDGHRQVHLRLNPSRNNQRIGINWADDYALEALHWLPHGAVAQLGERLAGSQKVTGSSPVGSTAEAAQDGRLRLL